MEESLGPRWPRKLGQAAPAPYSELRSVAVSFAVAVVASVAVESLWLSGFLRNSPVPK